MPDITPPLPIHSGGMPYYVADQHLSKWRNQYYDLKFRAATPLLGNHWALGLEGNYVYISCQTARPALWIPVFIRLGTERRGLPLQVE